MLLKANLTLKDKQRKKKNKGEKNIICLKWIILLYDNKF